MKARASGFVEMREKMRLNYPTNTKEWAVSVLSVVLIIFGLPLVIMGAQLAILGGSVYYVLAGAAIIASGIFILSGKTIGAWIYLCAWLITWFWAFWEVGFNAWALLPRVFGPTLLAIAVALTIPVLRNIEKFSVQSSRSAQ